MIVNSRSHGLDLAKALGIPTDKLRSFTLSVPLNDVVSVQAVYLLKDLDGKLVERVRRMRLTAEDAPE